MYREREIHVRLFKAQRYSLALERYKAATGLKIALNTLTIKRVQR